MTAAEMASEEEQKKRRDTEKWHLEAATIGKMEASTDQFLCGKCKNRKCTYYQLQTRSADEPMTTFVTCTVCNNRWVCSPFPILPPPLFLSLSYFPLAFSSSSSSFPFLAEPMAYGYLRRVLCVVIAEYVALTSPLSLFFLLLLLSLSASSFLFLRPPSSRVQSLAYALISLLFSPFPSYLTSLPNT